MLHVPPNLCDSIHIFPSKPPNHGRYGRRVTRFPSRKNSGGITCDSLLEADFCLLLERDTNIVSYVSQPCSVESVPHGTCYTPDFMVTFENGAEVYYEIKSDERLNSRRTVMIREIYQEIFAQCDRALVTVDASQIRSRLQEGNLDLLYWQSFNSNSNNVLRVVRKINLTKAKAATFSELVDKQITIHDIAYGIFYQLLLIEPCARLTTETVLTANPDAVRLIEVGTSSQYPAWERQTLPHRRPPTNQPNIIQPVWRIR